MYGHPRLVWGWGLVLYLTMGYGEGRAVCIALVCAALGILSFCRFCGSG